MSKPKSPAPAKLVIGCFTSDKAILEDVAPKLSQSFGPPDVISGWLPFEHTDYYASEMGSPLFRRLMAFRELIQPDTLVDIKLFTNDLEGQFSTHGKRLVNIDPGYLLAERFVLATGKNYSHRIYLRAGIYADLTLIYRKSRFHSLDWTYPDYAGDAIRAFLETVRLRYLYQVKHSGGQATE
jgi:hypothetical protein